MKSAALDDKYGYIKKEGKVVNLSKVKVPIRLRQVKRWFLDSTKKPAESIPLR